tara:strand:+ start:382 stop:651 length:270 start_codon:yes stop_codon:yes gene_type:complete
MTEQDKILRDIAKNHGISIQQAEEIWKLLTVKVIETISEQDKKEEGMYEADRFKTIHIDNFGKFIPNIRNINHANMCINMKKEGKTFKK